eukprot:gene16487-7682_t
MHLPHGGDTLIWYTYIGNRAARQRKPKITEVRPRHRPTGEEPTTAPNPALAAALLQQAAQARAEKRECLMVYRMTTGADKMQGLEALIGKRLSARELDYNNFRVKFGVGRGIIGVYLDRLAGVTATQMLEHKIWLVDWECYKNSALGHYTASWEYEWQQANRDTATVDTLMEQLVGQGGFGINDTW